MESCKVRVKELEKAYVGVLVENERLKRQIAHVKQLLNHARTHDPTCSVCAASDSLPSMHPLPGVDALSVTTLSTCEEPLVAELRRQALQVNRLELVLDGAKLGIWDWNTQTNEVVFNKQWKAMLGYEEHELEDNLETWKRLVHPDDFDHVIAKLTEHLEGKTTVYSTEHRVAHKDGHWVWILDTGKVVQWDAEGKPLRATGIHQDISWRKQLEQELITALDVAQGANKAKSAFLANMSHEIRTPMAGILGAGTLLMETPLDPDQEELAGMMVESTKLLLSIVNDILDLSKIEEGFLKIENIVMDLDEILVNVNKLFWLKAHEKGIVLQVKAIDPNWKWIISDPTRLRQILLNLVGNAVKFTNKGSVIVETEMGRRPRGCCTCVLPTAALPVGGERDGNSSSSSIAHHDIAIPTNTTIATNNANSSSNNNDATSSRSERSSEERAKGSGAPCRHCSSGSASESSVYEGIWDLRIRIRDTGIGMSPYMVEHVFDRFQQADGSTTRIYGGSGLGTTISKKLAALMGGDVTVTSEEGKGSTFTVALPVRLTPPPCASMTRSGEEDVSRNYGLTAILAEDNNLNRRILEKMFSSLGIKTIPAANGLAVMDRVADSPRHDLIFMDIQMPVCDGITATRQLRAKGYGRPIVALTANVMESDRQSYMVAGMNGTLPKPFTKALICAEIDRLLSSRILVSGADISGLTEDSTEVCSLLRTDAERFSDSERVEKVKRRRLTDSYC